jgi:hypothetical protein
MKRSIVGTPSRRRRRLYVVVTLAAAFVAVIALSSRGQSRGAMFSDIATMQLADAKLDSQGACWADIDQDGDQDLFVANYQRRHQGTSRLWRNDSGVFREIEMLRPQWPPQAMGCAFVDVDNDGDPDLYVTSKSNKSKGNILQSKLFLNDGAGVFRDVTTAAGVGLPGMGAASVDWADFDNDGDYDAFVATRSEENPNFLMRQVAPLRFRDVAPAMGLSDPVGPESTFLGSWIDYDGDGDLEILLAKDWWGIELFRNDGETYVNMTRTAFPRATDATPGAAPNNPMGVAWGDYDNDGCLDLFVSGMNVPGQSGFAAEAFSGDSTSRLYRSRCDGTFEDVTKAVALTPTGLVEWSVNFIDFDNDGDLDLSVVAGNTAEPLPAELGREHASSRKWATFVVTGLRKIIPQRVVAWLYRYEMMIPASGAIGPGAAMPIYLYRNMLVETGTATFRNVAYEIGIRTIGTSRGSAWADFDGDGALDWFVPGKGTPNRLFRNSGPVGNYLRVHLIGNPLRDAVGAWVRIRAEGKSQVRHVHVLDGYLSQSQMDAHFGLGKVTKVNEIWVRWPGTTVWRLACTDVPANHRVTIRQDQTGACR